MMKKLILLALLLLLNALSLPSLASNGGRGGGDLCEDQIKIIKSDLESWIKAGGGDGLLLTGTTAEQYATRMLEKIGAAKIRCVSEGDAFYPVEIDGTPKTCRFDINNEENWITCDAKKFMAAITPDQYVLVHHEIAGLAGLEIPNGVQSQYTISNQISSFLTATIVKKLYVKPKHQGPASYKDIINLNYVPTMDFYQAQQYCDAYNAHLPTAREFAEMAASTGSAGIRETQFPGLDATEEEKSQNAKDGYFPFPTASKVDFYFNGLGFKSELFDSQIPTPYANRLWMSTYETFKNADGSTSVLIFAESRMPWGENAGFIPAKTNENYATICLPGKDPKVAPTPRITN